MNKPGTAAVLSFIFCGLGQLYNGNILKGLVIIFFAGLSLLFIILGAVLIYVWLLQQAILELLWTGMGLFILGIVIICIVSIYSIVDAYKQAQK